MQFVHITLHHPLKYFSSTQTPYRVVIDGPYLLKKLYQQQTVFQTQLW
jgi:hypothetical protein